VSKMTSDSAARDFAHKTNGFDGWSAEDAYERGWRDSLAGATTIDVYLCEKRTKENNGKAFLTHVLHKHRTKDGGICPGPHRILLIKPEETI
jgi:hypothetical protein